MEELKRINLQKVDHREDAHHFGVEEVAGSGFKGHVGVPVGKKYDLLVATEYPPVGQCFFGYKMSSAEVPNPKSGKMHNVEYAQGFLKTSEIKEWIDENTFKTENSIYVISEHVPGRKV